MKIITVGTGEHAITSKGRLYTKSLEGCVGVALLDRSTKNQGLAHIYFGGSSKSAEVERQLRKGEKHLERFLYDFGCKSPQAVLAAVPFEFVGKPGYSNEMLTNLADYLRSNGINIRLVDDVRETPSRIVSSKDMVVTPEKIVIIYRDRGGHIGFGEERVIPL